MKLTSLRIFVVLFLSASIFCGCAAKFLKIENEGELAKISEYDEKVKVKAIPITADVANAIPPQPTDSTVPTTLVSASATAEKPADEKKDLKKKKEKKSKKKEDLKAAEASKGPAKREPDLEDSEGFTGRRPTVDPFWIGEKTTLQLSYFGVVGGDMVMEVRPHVEVNGRKAYHFAATIQSTALFSTFYSVDDFGETFMDFEDLIPFNFAVKVKESAQLREVRSFFDWKAMKSSFWEKKVTKKRGTEEKKLEWDILSFSHNVFSAPFYLRAFKLTPGKTIQFRVADEGRNMVVKATVLRREEVKVEAGTFNTVVLKPEVEIGGIFQPMGDVFFWLTDDDRKMYIKIEAKIKIGTIKAEAKELQYGIRPQ